MKGANWFIKSWREGAEGSGIYAQHPNGTAGRLCILTDDQSVEARLMLHAFDLIEALDGMTANYEVDGDCVCDRCRWQPVARALIARIEAGEHKEG